MWQLKVIFQLAAHNFFKWGKSYIEYNEPF